jgi:hypothetical protein
LPAEAVAMIGGDAGDSPRGPVELTGGPNGLPDEMLRQADRTPSRSEGPAR